MKKVNSGVGGRERDGERGRKRERVREREREGEREGEGGRERTQITCLFSFTERMVSG